MEALQSPLPSVSNEAWQAFVRCMICSNYSAVSPSNALGMFMLMPRRLADLGLVSTLQRKIVNGKTLYVAKFIPPLTSEKFLSSPHLQYQAFEKSMTAYCKTLDCTTLPSGMTLSGALAVLHRCGPNGLDSWKSGKRFEHTEALFKKTNELF